MSNGADELAVLDNGTAAHARVNIGPTYFCIVRFQRFPVYKKESHRISAIPLYDRSLDFYGVCYIRTNKISYFYFHLLIKKSFSFVSFTV